MKISKNKRERKREGCGGGGQCREQKIYENESIGNVELVLENKCFMCLILGNKWIY